MEKFSVPFFIILILAIATITGLFLTLNNRQNTYLDIETLWEDREVRIGKEIIVESKVKKGDIFCTAIGCLSENQCCNSCSGDMVADDVNIQISFVRSPNTPTCNGNECILDCDSLEDGKIYKFEGILRESNDIVGYKFVYNNFYEIK